MKLADKAILRMVSESPGRNSSEPIGGPDTLNPQRPSSLLQDEGNRVGRRLTDETYPRGQRQLEIQGRTRALAKKSAALRKSWAQLIKRVYQIDPLNCDCGGTLRVIAFITEHKVIRKILDHLDKRNGDSRAPPNH